MGTGYGIISALGICLLLKITFRGCEFQAVETWNMCHAKFCGLLVAAGKKHSREKNYHMMENAEKSMWVSLDKTCV